MSSIVILCGGIASRLGEKCKYVPKILLEINHIPFIELLIENYQKLGFKEFYFITGHLGDKILDYSANIRKKFPNLIFYYFNEGEERLGTGGSIKKFSPLLPDNFFLTYGDSFLNVSRKEIKYLSSIKNEPGINMLIYKNKDKFDISNISICFETKSIIEYEKGLLGKHEYIDAGLMFFCGAKYLFNKYSEEKFDLSKIIKGTIESIGVNVVINKHRFYEIGSLFGIQELEEYLMKEKK